LALHGQPGSHLHLDELNTEVCEQSLIIRRLIAVGPNIALNPDCRCAAAG
jgi:hypothetical protein